LVTLGRRGDVSTSTQLGIYGVLLSHTGRDQLERLTQRLLGPLRAEEDKRGTPLVATLSAYLGSGRRHAETASALNIHVNTLYQRLESIDRLIGTEWRTPDAALDLQVVLRLERSAKLTRGR
ncbi:MAG: transcriptional regulator, CdaR, partial [Mycobacterium sp.]|nr:transcriptional regulator, CdaR [Mycobacterium sp.]